MNILITGSNGQLGNEMRVQSALHPEHRYFFTDIAELDITSGEAVSSYVESNKIDLIVNCAAYTNVDKAEDDEPTALIINAEAVANLALTGKKIIHVSTDYVFSGKGFMPCREDDEVEPQTAYGRTKLEGEKRLLSLTPDAVILRTAWLYSSFGNNFVKTMLRLGKEKSELGVVYDQIGTPTYAADLATAIYAIICHQEWKSGIYHFTNEGVCSWFDFTHEIFRLYNEQHPSEPIVCAVRPIRSEEYAYRTPRPHYSVLDKAKIKQTFSLTIPYWTESLNRCLKQL